MPCGYEENCRQWVCCLLKLNTEQAQTGNISRWAAAIPPGKEIIMKWFRNVFLPSLEERYNARSGKMWLTEKQVAVCMRYMEFSRSVKGSMEYNIDEKTYIIQIAPNGCAAFHIMKNGWIVSHT